jgi:hypothetical protein
MRFVTILYFLCPWSPPRTTSMGTYWINFIKFLATKKSFLQHQWSQLLSEVYRPLALITFALV